MNKLKLITFISSCIFYLIGCHSSDTNRQNSQNINQINLDKNQYKFINPEETIDTFKIVNESGYFYYCFGEFTNPSILINHYANDFSVKKELTLVYNDPSIIDTLYRISKNGSFIKYHYQNSDEFKEAMMLVSGKILSSDFEMTNGLKVGIEKSTALKIIFSDNIPFETKKYNNIQIATVLTGVWINLKFDKDKLSEIDINTDCQVNKE